MEKGRFDSGKMDNLMSVSIFTKWWCKRKAKSKLNALCVCTSVHMLQLGLFPHLEGHGGTSCCQNRWSIILLLLLCHQHAAYTIILYIPCRAGFLNVSGLRQCRMDHFLNFLSSIWKFASIHLFFSSGSLLFLFWLEIQANSRGTTPIPWKLGKMHVDFFKNYFDYHITV